MDLTVLLTETTPAPDAPSSQALDAARTRLDDAASAAGRRLRASHVAKIRRRRRLLIATTAAAVALILVPLLGRGPGAVPSAAAAQVMLAAAQGAGAQDGGWSDAAYWHLTMELDYPTTAGQAPYRQELWLAHDGDGVSMSEDPATPTGPGGAPLYRDAGPSTFFAGGSVDWVGLYALPTDPEALVEVLRTGIRSNSTWDADTQLWVIVTDLLRASPASPELRRALWQIAATIPDVELLGHTTDALGRQGIALERDMTGQRLYRARLILDPETGRILEELSYDPDGQLSYRMTVIDQGPAATAPTPDPPYCGPGSDPYTSC